MLVKSIEVVDFALNSSRYLKERSSKIYYAIFIQLMMSQVHRYPSLSFLFHNIKICRRRFTYKNHQKFVIHMLEIYFQMFIKKLIFICCSMRKVVITRTCAPTESCQYTWMFGFPRKVFTPCKWQTFGWDSAENLIVDARYKLFITSRSVCHSYIIRNYVWRVLLRIV